MLPSLSRLVCTPDVFGGFGFGGGVACIIYYSNK
jgi:hypothetical protein